MGWTKSIIDWTEDDTAFLSITFTWQLPQAYPLCIWYKQLGYHVKVGGVAVSLMPDYLRGVAEIGNNNTDVLWRHNPDATFTSRGCIRTCDFCAVPKIEGELVELQNWEVKPVVCDNNLLACSRRHFDKVIDSLKSLKNVDFNQGLDARLLNAYHISRLRELNLSVVRLAWDHIEEENIVLRAIHALLDAGFPKSKIRAYVLFNYKDTPDDALYRCETLKAMGILPNVQRFQPLDTLRKNSYISPHWNKVLLADFARYWSRQIYLYHIPFSEYICKPSEWARNGF